MPKDIKVLLVEDDNLLVRMYQDKLKSDGFAVSTAGDGAEGFKKAESEKPDLILLDIMMPKVDGFEMLNNLKKDSALKKTPVILLTNLGGKDDAKKGLEMGAVAYLIKSDYTPDEIVKKIKEILNASTRDNIPKAVKISEKKETGKSD